MEKLLAVLILFFMLLSGCSVFHRHPESLAVYDLAVQPSRDTLNIAKQKLLAKKEYSDKRCFSTILVG